MGGEVGGDLGFGWWWLLLLLLGFCGGGGGGLGVRVGDVVWVGGLCELGGVSGGVETHVVVEASDETM